MTIASSIVAALLAIGCRPSPPVAEVDMSLPLPAIAAQFKTTWTTADGESTVDWRLWREPQRIVLENLTDRTADHWERDGSVIFRRKVFHDERRGIELQPSEFQLLVGEQWTAPGLGFDPALLQTLSEKNSGWRNGEPYRRFAGNSEGVQWNITLAVEQMLPVEINRRSAGETVRTRLVSWSPRDAASWQPLTIADYELVDFADLGDRQADPFVSGVALQLGLGHGH